ncbi:hypothetical protein KO500_14080 [Cellulophaga baltica]|uniref:hypothetical protein n=1 Tax=Cellulophaga TaxID=104264 RepID=UPI001C06EC85|nr:MULTISPECIES: hypothetical protein [Cellulophaga]MBU2997573.1 hypothetical protein [Cellulophaga baltica]MDO6768968.1 hypothetical protein [Cellulophaga sp. 1_MG-2023]
MNFIKKNYTKILIISSCFFIYIYNQKIFRPKIYSNYESNEYLIFIIGVLPNLLGAIITFLIYILIFENLLKGKKDFREILRNAVIWTLSLVIFMELERLISSGIRFDFFDILASIIGIIFCLLLYKKDVRFYE